ncbi:MAG: hypothetical protein WCI34_04775 [Actinomycetes bacterium]
MVGAISTFIIFVVIAVVVIAGMYGSGDSADSSNSAITGTLTVAALGLIASLFFQVSMTIKLMEKWTGFTIDYWTEFWILIVAAAAELITTFVLGPLSIIVFVLIQWWLTKDRATPVAGARVR